MEILFHLFLTSDLDGDEWLTSNPGPPNPIETIRQQILKETVWAPDNLEKRSISLPYW